MRKDLNQLVAIHVFDKEWTVIQDKVKMGPTAKLSPIPDFCSNLNWSWKAVQRMLKKQSYIGVIDISHDEYTTRMNIHDANGKKAVELDLVHTEELTFPTALAICALCATGFSKELALDVFYKGMLEKKDR